MPALLVLEHCPQEQLQGIVGSGAFPDKGHVAAQEHEIRRLTEELRKVTMERDILRKGHGVLRAAVKVKYAVNI